jgi:hypothetical protein
MIWTSDALRDFSDPAASGQMLRGTVAGGAGDEARTQASPAHWLQSQEGGVA